VARFVEKPNLQTAKRYVKSGNYFWNSGIFMWKASAVLEELAKQNPGLFRSLKQIHALWKSGDSKEKVPKLYKRLEAVSIDHGVMEHSPRSAVIPVHFEWSDVGSWSSLQEVGDCNEDGNVTYGNIVDLGSKNSVLFADQRIVATIGLSDMVVVDLEHRTVYRPWGSYTLLEEAQGYKVKRITVIPGKRLSLQMHHQRSEHWVVIKGRALVNRGEQEYELKAGESTGIPSETPHRLGNPGTTPLEIIEIQNGPYLGEDDIVRFHDDFGRHTKTKRAGK
jgi:mannose-6-phosphate isomerase-like protein (cupin superfamily)